MHYKEDIILALELYIHHQKSNHNLYYNSNTFVSHYCKKFSVPKSKYKDKLVKIYNEYMEENK